MPTAVLASRLKAMVWLLTRRLITGLCPSRLRRVLAKGVWSVAPTLLMRRARRQMRRKVAGGVSGTPTDSLRMASEAGRLKMQPLMSVLVPVYNTEPGYLQRAVDSVLAQGYPKWELILCDDGSTSARTLAALDELEARDKRVRVHKSVSNGGISAATNAALALATGEFVAMLDHDDELLPAALLEVAKALDTDPTLDVVYTDQDSIDPDGTVVHTFYKPDWSLEMLRGVMYVGHLLVVRRSLAESVGGFDSAFDAVQDFEFMLRLAEKTERIAHVPKILYHWRRVPGSVALGVHEKSDIERLQVAAVTAHLARCGQSATAQSNPDHPHQVLITPAPRAEYPLISVIICGADVQAFVEQCAQRVLSVSTYPQREIIVAGGDVSSDGADRLAALGARVVALGAGGAEATAAALHQARADLVVFMRGDLYVQTADWLESLLFELEKPRVACVTPLVLAPSGRVSSAGLALYGARVVVPVSRGWDPAGQGYAGSLSCVHEVAAVPGECYAASRQVIERCEGFSPYLAGAEAQTIDLSLRAFSAGLRNLYTPRVVVRHLAKPATDRKTGTLDRLLLADTWSPLLDNGDPFHNRGYWQTVFKGQS